jgi:hypothetical protein
VAGDAGADAIGGTGDKRDAGMRRMGGVGGHESACKIGASVRGFNSSLA